MKAYLLVALSTLFFCNSLLSQNDLLEELEQEATEEVFEQPAFKAMKIGNLQSTKVADKGDLYMYISHRFGSLKDGFSTFFGFDNANTKMQLFYGVFDGVQVGLARESLHKTYSSHVKVSIVKQSKKSPVNLVGYSTINLRTDIRKEQHPFIIFEDKLSYATQLLISRRFTNSFSLELAPTYVRQNLVLSSHQKHDQFALGIGGRMKVSKRISINAEYVYNFSRYTHSIYNNPLTVGVDIETGGHVFQLLFSNAQSTNEPGFISNAEGKWFKDVFFGFNIVRVF